jgi:bifunctional non-homologous end joining protein LigD
MVIPSLMPLTVQSRPFDDPNWLFEIKHDGFRGLALIDRGDCWFLSRRKHKFNRFPELAAALARELRVDMAVLDGEIAVPDETGRTVFAALIKRKQQARYYAFDLLWLNGQDLRELPLIQRKEMLKRILPRRSGHVLYVDHMRETGTKLYRLACQLDLEGIVAKRLDSPYDNARGAWIKIKNHAYGQKEGRADFFHRAG